MQTIDPRAAAALELVERMAGWVLDGEPATAELAEHAEEKVNGEGNYILENDEAYDTVHAWVGEAREILAAPPESAEQTWTFFGHYSDADELVIDHAVKGEHDDDREDDGLYAGGLWCDSGTGATQAEAERNARAEYEHVHYVVEFDNGVPVGPGYVSVSSYNQTRDQLHADAADARAERMTVSRLYAERVLGTPEECDCGQSEPSSAFAEGHSVGYYATRPAKYDNPWQQAEYERGVAFGKDRWQDEEDVAAEAASA